MNSLPISAEIGLETSFVDDIQNFVSISSCQFQLVQLLSSHLK